MLLEYRAANLQLCFSFSTCVLMTDRVRLLQSDEVT